ncbi:MAG: 2-oxoglutarate dehydrogenase E1 component [Rubrobacter sp.]
MEKQTEYQFYGPNLGYVLELYERYREDPDSVDEGAREFFGSWNPPRPNGTNGGAATAPRDIDLDVERAVGASKHVRHIRDFGHRAAKLDPLGSEPPGDPTLDPQFYRITDEDLETLPPLIIGGPIAKRSATAREAVEELRNLYCNTTGYDFGHVHDPDERFWLREAVESVRFAKRLEGDGAKRLLMRLTRIDTFEKFLHKSFLGQKRFSVEGNDMVVPMLNLLARRATEGGTPEMVLGMAHRGRLNVLAHVLDKSYSRIFGEFKQPEKGESSSAGGRPGDAWVGDVKYHLGVRGYHLSEAEADEQVLVNLAPNPSHLEHVNPVVEGMARAAQERRDSAGPPVRDEEKSLPVILHGDAAFPGEGVSAETLNLSRLPGYRTGGTIHIITNNQLGFTTERQDARSTTYASDLAKGYEIPVVHVNADDPEACLAATRLAYAYRERFHKDFLIDLIGYRRFGHNEGDEPAYTQPVMYQKIKDHPTVREIWAKEIEDRGDITAGEAEGMVEEIQARMEEIRKKPKDEVGDDDLETGQPHTPVVEVPETAVPAEKLVELNAALLERPEGFTPNTKLERLLRKTRETLGENGEERIDWAHAETLAFASLLEDGVPIRLTGQDSERGTFSQRHLVLHDEKVGEDYVPMQNIPQAKASFAVHNSPLSEIAVMGFEYGYTMNADDALVVWEAQYGDFANVGQPMIDQFIVSGQAKWGETSGLVMLLPHGYEGQGPEHSSARLERFLQLAAMENVRIANLTTAAQYFHLLRAQAQLKENKRPLIIMAPKSLLRHAMASSGLKEFSEGRFQTVLDDEGARGRAEDIERLILCSGKFYTELAESDTRKENDSTAVVRVELLYPWPGESIREVLEGYPNLREVAWAQEEPANMGAWTFVRPRLEELLGGEVPLRYVGKPARPSPAQGSARYHKEEHAAIVRDAFEENGHEEKDKEVVEATQERASSPSA